ncbi:MAG: hypothetical protein L0H65_07475 [Pseudorhodobacter sp.]|nr:hypothetical protein [Pseudorhodobacter sp.]
MQHIIRRKIGDYCRVDDRFTFGSIDCVNQEQVCTLAAGHGVGRGLRKARITDQRVIAGATIKVIAIEIGQFSQTATGNYEVIARITRKVVRAIDITEDVAAEAAVHCVIAKFAFEEIIACATMKHIIAAAANHSIIIAAAEQAIIIAPSQNSVIPAVAMNFIIVMVAAQLVVAATAPDGVVTRLASKQVISGIPENLILATHSEQGVIPCKTVYQVVTLGAIDRIRIFGAVDDVRRFIRCRIIIIVGIVQKKTTEQQHRQRTQKQNVHSSPQNSRTCSEG